MTQKVVSYQIADAIDLKQYEPAMRHLIDSYIRADPSEVISEFDDFSLIELIVQRGADAVMLLPLSHATSMPIPGAPNSTGGCGL